MNTKLFRVFAAGAALAMVAVLPACLPNPPEGTTACESFGGTFAVGTGNVVWTCTNLPTFDPDLDDRFDQRFMVLNDACQADGGTILRQPEDPPQDATCLQ